METGRNFKDQIICFPLILDVGCGNGTFMFPKSKKSTK
jgi:tRNA G46 methylase TrmB